MKNMIGRTLVLLVIVILLAPFNGFSQDYETQLDYFPAKRNEVTEKAHRRGSFILKQVYLSIKEDNLNISYANHLNIARAFTHLKEPKEDILREISLAQEINLERTAEIFVTFYNTADKFNLTQNEFDSLMQKFHAIYKQSQIEKSEVDLDQYSRESNLDENLVKFIVTVGEKDQEHRSEGADSYSKNIELQNKIDNSNMLKIDSLYHKYKAYVGKSLVGEKYKHVMWQVIQHSTLDKQEKYLPIVQKAAQESELTETPFKMLIDRIYAKKYGYQIFGSQVDVDLAPDSEMQRVKEKFGIK